MPKKGYKQTPEARTNMSLATIKRYENPEARAKMSQAKLGHTHTPETLSLIHI